MMPTVWVPHIVHYIEAHAGTDAGLHLTLTSEWREYRGDLWRERPACPA
jgi:hypothetical protein